MSKRYVLLSASALALCWQLPVYAVDKSAAASATTKLTPAVQATASPSEVKPLYSQAELDQMLAPVALYPDTVLSHVLIAATYPLEIVKATRWLAEKPGMTSSEALKSAENEPWDPSVRALVAFPPLLTKMNNELDWTQRLGDAFLAQEAQVMDTVQQLREKAYAAGNLSNESQIRVERREKVIVIEPAQPELVYVPIYDTRVVYGNWWWQQYPPIHWPAPRYQRSGFYWGAAVQVSPGFYFSTFYWPRREVVVINHYDSSPRYYRSYDIIEHRERRHWRHEPEHRRGVVYPSQYRPVRESYGLDQPRQWPQRYQQQEERRQWASERRSERRIAVPTDQERARYERRVNEQYGGSTDGNWQRRGQNVGSRPVETDQRPDALGQERRQFNHDSTTIESNNLRQQTERTINSDPLRNSETRRQWQRVDDSGFADKQHGHERVRELSREPQYERPASVNPLPQYQPPPSEPLQRVREYRRDDSAQPAVRFEPQRIEPQRIEPQRMEQRHYEPQRIEQPRMEQPRIEQPRIEQPRFERQHFERADSMPQQRHEQGSQQAPQVIEQAGGNQE